MTLPSIPPGELRAVLGGEATAAEIEPLGHGPPAATVGVWRVRVAGASAVLKVVEHNADGHPRWPSAADPDHPYYWRREPLTYESGLLDRLGELRGPRLLASVARDDGTVALWLEDAPPPPAFTPDLLGEVARRLGEAQGAFAVEPPAQRGCRVAGCAPTSLSALQSPASRSACSRVWRPHRRRSATSTSIRRTCSGQTPR